VREQPFCLPCTVWTRVFLMNVCRILVGRLW
jgi:hypothetical protein